MISRRGFMQLAAAGGVGIGLAGNIKVFRDIIPFTQKGEKARHAVWGNSDVPEWRFDPQTGRHLPNPDIMLRHTTDLQCHSECGLRVKIDRKTGRILRIMGNPYHKNCREDYVPMDEPLHETARRPGTVCARGNAGLQTAYDPYRVRVPLKRVGPRGSRRWKPISWEQLIEEVVEGGRIFADIGDPASADIEVLGFKGLYAKRNEPMDPDAPELGPRTNGFVFQGGRIKKSRLDFVKRFTTAFGSVNAYEHTNVCEVSHHVATEAVYPTKHAVKPDVMGAEFLMFWGTSPGDANFPMQTFGRMVAQARAKGMRYVCIDPVAQRGSVQGEFVEWVPIRPGTDGALALAIAQWMIANGRYAKSYLEHPNRKSALAHGELSHTDASHLVIVDPDHPRYGAFLSRTEAGLGRPGEEPLESFAVSTEEWNMDKGLVLTHEDDRDRVVIDAASGRPRAATESERALIEFDGTVAGVRVKTAFTIFKEAAFTHTIEEYSEICGVPVDKIVDLAREFTSHGRHAACEFYRGAVKHPNGFYNGMAIHMLNLLIGNCNWRGGIGAGGGHYSWSSGRYDLKSIPGLKEKPHGVPLTREGVYYERSSEYRRKKERGENPYPAKRPWFPHTFNVYSELLPSAVERYPYGVDILLWHMATPFYSVPGQGNEELIEKVKDPRNIPLIIASDIVIGDTSMYADYIIPDVTFLERWVHIGMHELILVKGTSVRWPVIDPIPETTADGRPYSLETFLIDVAERLGLPGFGEKAIADNSGRLWPLHRAEDFYLKATANVAFAEGRPVSPASPEDIAICGLDGFRKRYEDALRAEEWPAVLKVLSRGGRFEPPANAWNGDQLGHQYKHRLNFYSEAVATSFNSMTGERFPGHAHWREPATIMGKPLASLDPSEDWPLTIITYKGALQTHSRLSSNTVLREIQPSNWVEVAAADARRLGLKDGDRVWVETPEGRRRGRVKVREGLVPGVITFSVGFGHWGYGATQVEIGGKVISGDRIRRAGILLNPVMRRDPDVWQMPLMDPVGGSAVFYQTRARLVRAEGAAHAEAA
ncbi:MAG: tetrathionate reductase subunit TtrA [Verrucomicrobia bacterium]|nr:MAG: tetrathionate reductase subunit TtrA [Verrucomicrobiota bacterium]